MSHAATNKSELALLALALALLAAVALRPSIRGNDGVGHYVYLASILRDGDLDFTNEYRDFDSLMAYPFRFSDLPRCPRTGLPSDRYGVGSALLWAPLTVIVHQTLRLLDPAAADAMSPPYGWAVGVSTVLWGSLGLLLLYDRLRREASRLASLATVAGLVLATPLGFYLYAHGSMAHGVSFFAATGAMLSFEAAWHRPRPAPMAWCGFWVALLALIRIQDASWGLVIAAALCGRALWETSRKETPRRWLPVAGLACFALAAALTFAPQLAVWKVLYGSWLSGPMPYLDSSAGQFSRGPIHALDALFSARHGALSWHPLLAAALAGLVLFGFRHRSQRAVSTVALTGFVVQTALAGSWSIWWAGASFGNRFFVSALPWLALGLPPWLARARSRPAKTAVLMVLAFLILWNLGLLIQYGTEMIPREAPISWPAVARHNIIDVPAWLWRRLF